MKYLSYLILIIILSIGNIAVANTWHNPDMWVQDGKEVSALKMGDNFDYLLALQSSLCTEHSKTAVRFYNQSFQYCNGSQWVSIESGNVVTSAVNAVWEGTTWITTSNSVVHATKIAQNFKYLLGLRGGVCTPHNTNRVRHNNGILEYCSAGTWKPVFVYTWDVGSWGACIGSVQTRSVTCIDKDGFVVDDNKCTTTKPATSQSCTTPTECSDGIDNDGNGLIDMEDVAGCTSPEDDDESFVWSISVICTELYRQGLLSDEWLEADTRFGSKMPKIVMNGYHAWANPVVRAMQKSEKVTKIVNTIAQPWAREMAYQEGVLEKGSIIGKVLMFIGVPLSGLVGVGVYIVDLFTAFFGKISELL